MVSLSFPNLGLSGPDLETGSVSSNAAWGREGIVERESGEGEEEEDGGAGSTKLGIFVPGESVPFLEVSKSSVDAFLFSSLPLPVVYICSALLSAVDVVVGIGVIGGSFVGSIFSVGIFGLGLSVKLFSAGLLLHVCLFSVCWCENLSVKAGEEVEGVG